MSNYLFRHKKYLGILDPNKPKKHIYVDMPQKMVEKTSKILYTPGIYNVNTIELGLKWCNISEEKFHVIRLWKRLMTVLP